jgi:integrase
MAAKLEKTRTPGVFKRGSRYVVVYYAGGKQRKESARTLEAARRIKSERETEVAKARYREPSQTTLNEYALEWVERYQGGKRGLRDAGRAEYRRVLEQYALTFFPANLRLDEIRPKHVAQYVGWLCEPRADGSRLSDKSVRNYVGPLSACLESARLEGEIDSNPARGVPLPRRPTIESEDAEQIRVLTREQLSTFPRIVHPRHRLFFELLASTGLRVSEAIALEWRHVQLDGSEPHVKVRQGVVRGTLGPPKTRHSKRDVPISRELVDALRAHRKDTEWPGDEQLVFAATNGELLHVGNLRRRVLKPAAEEAGAPWMGFHTLRHTCGSLLFASGRNAVQVQHWLGHHSAAFTLSRYVHLLEGDIGEPLSLGDELLGGNKVAIRPTPFDTKADTTLEPNVAL